VVTVPSAVHAVHYDSGLRNNRSVFQVGSRTRLRLNKEKWYMNGLTKRVGRVVAGLLVATTALTAVASTSGAGAPVLTVTPTSVHTGATLDLSGSCYGDTVNYGLYAGTITGNTAPSGTALDTGTFSMIGSTWTGTLTVPGGTAPGEYTVNAECVGDGSYYSNASVTVLPDDTTTTVAPSTTAAPTTTAPQPPAAAPAVVAQPTYTG